MFWLNFIKITIHIYLLCHLLFHLSCLFSYPFPCNFGLCTRYLLDTEWHLALSFVKEGLNFIQGDIITDTALFSFHFFPRMLNLTQIHFGYFTVLFNSNITCVPLESIFLIGDFKNSEISRTFLSLEPLGCQIKSSLQSMLLLDLLLSKQW